MITPILFKRIFFSILFIVLGFSSVIYFYSVPLIRNSLYSTQEEAAKTILESVYHLVITEYMSIEAYREYALDAYKRQLKNICLFQESFMKNKYRQFKQGLISEEDAKRQALEELRSFRYGNNDYVWVSDYNSVLLLHPDPRLYLADYSLVSDKNGKLIVPSVVKIAREKGQGYTSYWWRRLKNEKFIEKLTYSKDFPEWKWVIATGVYIDDVEEEVARRKKKMIEEIRLILNKVKIARTGYMYIFDSDINMIIHPNSNIEDTNFSGLLNPVTNNSIGKELIKAAHSNDPKLFYKWDKPNNKDRYIYEKISWVKYVEGFDWYLASSVYVGELKSTAVTIRNRILMVTAIIFLASLGIASLFLNKILVPIRTLSKMAVKVSDGDFSVRYDIATGKDEIGVLASAFNSMVTRIKTNISNLDMEVHKRTRDIVMTNEQMMREIEDRKVAEEALRESEEKYRTILESIEDGYYEVDLAGNIMFFNDSLCRHLGYTRDELVNMNFRNIADGIYAEKITHTFARTYKTGESVKAFDWKFVRKDGSKYYVETSVSLMKNSKDRATGFRGIARDITERKKAEQELEYMAYHDSLTGLYNRKAFLEELKTVLIFAKRYENRKSLFFLDLDKFKQVNDIYGHETGDKLLKEVAARLKESVRDSDHVCRLGGDEFTIILNTEICSGKVARRIREKISQPYYIDENIIDFITPSIGISAYPDDGHDVDTLINCADTAMYEAKIERNQYVNYSELNKNELRVKR